MNGGGVLIIGKSGSGKSSFALEMISRGADLVADDRVVLRESPDHGILMTAAPNIAGLIEARSVGLIRLNAVDARLALVVDLDETESQRLPETRYRKVLGTPIRYLRKVESPAFPAMVCAVLMGGLCDDDL